MDSQLPTTRSMNNLNLNKTMSLSMKLRAEAATIALSRPNTTQTLPRLNKTSTPKNIHFKSSSPKSDVAKLYERLSGSYETAGYESFPLQETICHPITVCVRCANHASLCVPCADTMSQEAVEFFRRAQAVGAYRLFNGAIKQAGCEKVLKFVIFRCWKNSIRLRKYGRGQRHNRTEKRYVDLILRDPFRAWVKFTHECQHERREKREQQLEERIKVLEQQLNKYVADKANTDKQIRVLQLAKADADDDIRKLKSLLKESEEVIHEERCRVLKLSKIIEEVSPRFLGVVKDSAVATLTTTLRHINLTSNFHQSSLNLTRLTKSSKSSTSRDSSTISSRKSTISKGTFIPETGPIPKEGSVGAQLLSWVNSMSKSMSGITILIDSGHNILLDDYLPPYQELRSLETLKNGQQVARVVFKLISQCLAKSASLVPPIQSTSTRSTSRRLDDNSEKKVITLEKLNLLKEVHQSNPPQLYSILMEYLQGYFPNFTPLQLDRILSGTIDSIEILLSELIFLWCGMDGHTLFIDERNEIQKLTEKQHHHLQEVEKFVSELQKTKLFNLGLTTSATTSSITEEDENKNTEEGERIENISFDMTPYLHDDIYQPISRAIDDYFTLKLPEELFKLFTEFHNEIQLTNEFINTVYLKEKLASNGLQYLIDTQRNFALNCIHHIAEIERSTGSNTRTSSYEDQNLNEETY